VKVPERVADLIGQLARAARAPARRVAAVSASRRAAELWSGQGDGGVGGGWRGGHGGVDAPSWHRPNVNYRQLTSKRNTLGSNMTTPQTSPVAAQSICDLLTISVRERLFRSLFLFRSRISDLLPPHVGFVRRKAGGDDVGLTRSGNARVG